MERSRIVAGLLIIVAGVLPAAASAAPPEPDPYRANDFSGGSSYNIVPPGQNGTTTAAQAAAFLATGNRPPHQADQNDMYANLVYEAPNLQESQILDYFKDASFGVPPGEAERTYGPGCSVVIEPSPQSQHCDDVTIVRDGFGVPHIYGQDRAALMFGIGYATGEDRLFLADVLRHAGRGELSSFAGGANVGMDRGTFGAAPYASDAELQLQIDRAGALYGEVGRQLVADAENYVDGLNQWIAETRADPLKLDLLYTATGNPPPEPFEEVDVVAAATLVASIFGQGGGGEIGAATALQSARQELGKAKGAAVWRDFRSGDDPEAPSTVHGDRFPYRTIPKPGEVRGMAMPDPGSVVREPLLLGQSREPAAARDFEPVPFPEALEPYRDELQELGLLGDVRSAAGGMSNALLVSGRESEGGHPTAVMGPQTSYFAPQLLMEQDIHAPASREGPAIHARGVAFVGTNLYVQLGRGVDYSFSATSAGQDIIDTFAFELCEPDGSAPTIDSGHYIWNRNCIPLESIEKTNSWNPSIADSTPAGSETMRRFRTKAGYVTHRATIEGDPYVYTALRATYFHEVDPTAAAFADWNSPDVIKGPKSYIKAAYRNDLTFNWFYADAEKIAYINSGANPVRAKGTHPNFPVLGKRKFLWKGYDPVDQTYEREPLKARPQVIDQRYLTSWNNKPAAGTRCDGIRCYSSIYRSDPLDDRIEAGIRGEEKMSLVELINAMEDAGTVDLRGDAVVPIALRAIGKPAKLSAPARAAVATMREWSRTGAHRRDLDNDGAYDQAEAVRIMDAWWPLWVEGEFEPTLGPELHGTFIGSGGAIHNAPGAGGSAFQNVVYGFVHKDLRSALGEDVEGEYSRVYCGKGKLPQCRAMLIRTLIEAAATPPEAIYGSSGCELNNGTQASPQMCRDAVNSTDLTVAGVGPFHWINRPTFQQAVQYQGGR